MVGSEHRVKYLLSPLAIIDLLAILPFYVPFVSADMLFLRSVRFFRLFRVVKLGRYPTKAKSLYNQIGTVLSKGGFKRVERGIYGLASALKAAAAAPAKATKAPKAPKAKVRGKRRKFAETGEQFVLGLLKGKSLKTSDITKAWAASGRGGKAENSLTKLVQSKRINREKLKGAKGSTYSLA